MLRLVRRGTHRGKLVSAVLPHFRCSSRPGDQGKALRCLALPTSRTAPVSNRQQARNRPRTSFALNGITVLVLLYLHRKCGRTVSARFLVRLLGRRLGRVRLLLDAWFMRARLIEAALAEGHTVI